MGVYSLDAYLWALRCSRPSCGIGPGIIFVSVDILFRINKTLLKHLVQDTEQI